MAGTAAGWRISTSRRSSANAVMCPAGVLAEPPGRVLAAFAAQEGAVTAWFLLLAASALALVPGAVLLGRLLPAGPAASLSVPGGAGGAGAGAGAAAVADPGQRSAVWM
ncbi:hypothetical protein ACWDA3_33895 [Nonomuraea rubra]